jgi:hypothetical protein
MAGSKEGLYRYCEPSDGTNMLREKIKSVLRAIGDVVRTFDVQMSLQGGLAFSRGVAPDQARMIAPDRAQVTAWVDVPDAIREQLDQIAAASTTTTTTTDMFLPVQCAVKVSFMDVVNMVVDVEAKAAGSSSERTSLYLEDLRTRIVDVSAMVAGVIERKESLASVNDQVAALQNELKQMTMFGKGKMSRESRIEMLENREQLQAVMDDVLRAMADYAHASASAQARAMDIRHAGTFVSNRRQRRIDQRVATNAATIDASSIEAKLLALSLSLQPGTRWTADALDFYRCTLSQMHIQELLKEDPLDILGFGLSVERSELVVDAVSGTRGKGEGS